MVSGEGVAVILKKVTSITNWPTPKIATEVRSFLGLVGYYQKFVKGFSSLPKPMTQLTGKGVKFEWSEHCVESFKKLKEHLTKTPVLVLPRTGVTYMVYTDALGMRL